MTIQMESVLLVPRPFDSGHQTLKESRNFFNNLVVIVIQFGFFVRVHLPLNTGAHFIEIVPDLMMTGILWVRC